MLSKLYKIEISTLLKLACEAYTTQNNLTLSLSFYRSENERCFNKHTLNAKTVTCNMLIGKYRFSCGYDRVTLQRLGKMNHSYH